MRAAILLLVVLYVSLVAGQTVGTEDVGVTKQPESNNTNSDVSSFQTWMGYIDAIQTPCVKHICHLQPPLPFLLYIMNIIGLIIYFIPNKKKSDSLYSSDECQIKYSDQEDVVYDRGKGQEYKTMVGKLDRDICEEEPPIVKTKNKYFTKYQIGTNDNKSYYRYYGDKSEECSSISIEKKSDECSTTSDEKKTEEDIRDSYDKISEDSLNYDNERKKDTGFNHENKKKSVDNSKYDRNAFYGKRNNECDEYIRERSPYCASDFRIQQTDECAEAPRKQRFGHLYGEDRKRKTSAVDKQKGSSDLRKEMYNKRPEMKIYIETANEYPTVSGDERRTSRGSRTEPKIMLIKSPSVEQEETSPKEKLESRRNTARSKGSIVSHFNAQMNELDEQLKGKMEKLNSYAPLGEDGRKSSVGRVSKMHSHVSILEEVKESSPTQKSKLPSLISLLEAKRNSSVNKINKLNSLLQVEDEKNVSFANKGQRESSLKKVPSFLEQLEKTRLSGTPALLTDKQDDLKEPTFTEPRYRRSDRSTTVQIVDERERRETSKYHASIVSPESENKPMGKKLSRKSSRTSVSVNSMILVESLEALALAKLITNEMNHAIRKEEGDKQGYYKNQSKDSVVQRSEVELLVIPRELLKVQKKIESKLNTIIRQGGPKCSYVKELKKFFPYHSENKAIFPCNINYGHSNKFLSQSLFHKFLRKLGKKYEIHKNRFFLKRNTHDDGLVSIERNDKNDHLKSMAHQLYPPERGAKNEIKRENLFVQKSNKEGKRGNAHHQNYIRLKRHEQVCPKVTIQEVDAKAISTEENKQIGIKSSFLNGPTHQRNDVISDNEDSDYKIASVIQNLYTFDHRNCHRCPSEDKSCAKRILKLKIIAQDLKHIHTELTENLQNLRNFISQRSHITTQNAGDYVKEMGESGITKELSQSIVKNRLSPLSSSKSLKPDGKSSFNKQTSPTLPDFIENRLKIKKNPQDSVNQNSKVSKINRYLIKSKPRCYKFKGNLHMKHRRLSKRKKSLKMLIWKHLFHELMEETFKNSSVKTLLSMLKQEKMEKQKSSRRKKLESDVNEKSSLSAKTETPEATKSTDISSEPSTKQEDSVKPSTSTSETFMIEEIEKCSNKFSQSSQTKISESVLSSLQNERENAEGFNNDTNKSSNDEIKENTPLETSNINSSLSKSTSINSSLLDKLESNSLDDNSNIKEAKQSWASIISHEEKFDNDKQEMQRSLTEVLDLLTRPCPDLVDSQKDLIDFNSENSNEDTMNMPNATSKAGDSIYSLTPKISSDFQEDKEDTGTLKNMASWKNAFDIVLQYSISSKEINLVEEENIDNHLESGVL